jgi:hypothetical protein
LRAVKVRDLIRELQRFDPAARVVLSAGGHQLPHPSVGVGLQAATREPCVVVADRGSFAGRLPDMLLLVDPS